MDQDKFGDAFKIERMAWLGLGPSFLLFPGFLQSLLIFLVSKQEWDVPEILLGRQRSHEDHDMDMLHCF